MEICLICCFIFMIFSICYFINNIIIEWGDLTIEDVLKAALSLVFFIFSIISVVNGINYEVKTKTKIKEYETKIKNTAPITETNKIIVDGKEYEGKLIDKKLSSFVQLRSEDENIIIIEPKSIIIKN